MVFYILIGFLCFVFIAFCFLNLYMPRKLNHSSFYQFGLSGVPGKAPVCRQVVQYHISHALYPVPEAIFKFHQLYVGSTNSCCAVTHHWPYVV